MKKLLKYTLGGLGLLFGTLILLAIFSGGDDADTENAADATNAPTVAADLAEEEPAATDEPAATGDPEPDPAVVEYIDWAQKTVGTIGEATSTIGEQFTAAGENVLLIRDQDWILKTSLAIAMLNVAADSIRAQNVPPEMVEAHEVALAIADELTTIYEVTPAAIDNMDVDGLETASEAMTKVGQLAPLWAAEMVTGSGE